MTEVDLILDRLRRLGHARDRAVDTEVRTITLTDDEAVLLVAHCDHNDPRWHPTTAEAEPGEG